MAQPRLLSTSPTVRQATPSASLRWRSICALSARITEMPARTLGIATMSLALPALFACGTGDGQPAGESIGEISGALHTTNLLPNASPTVCFVEQAGSTNFAGWVQDIHSAMTQWEAASGLDFVFQGDWECDPAVGGVFPGDIRILVNESQTLPTSIPGCTQALEGSNSGAFPGTISTQCEYNASFWVDQPINNYLHESGHTIGFLHEHIRTTTPAACQVPGHPISDGTLLVPYDIKSVMHYSVCTAPGNGGTTGLSEYDRLGVEISYPKSTQIPIAAVGALTYAGGFAFRTDTGGSITPEWSVRGALASVFSSFSWTIGGSVTNGLSRSITLGLGSGVTATMQFTDPWGRSRSGSKVIWQDNAKHALMVMAVSGS
jgi:hypothetical protein